MQANYTINGEEPTCEDMYGMTTEQLQGKFESGMEELFELLKEAMEVIDEIREEQGDEVADILHKNLQYEVADMILDFNLLDDLK